MNKFSLEIDLYALYLLKLVAKHRGFTAASEEAGISQSALTRQVQNVEAKLGIKVFDRTTRSVSLNEAGAVFLRETDAIPNILSGALRRIKEDYLEAPREIRIGISQGLALAHIPGIFHAQQQAHPDVTVVVSQVDEATLLEQVSLSRLDLGILTKPERLPDSVIAKHTMEDQFVLVAPAQMEFPKGKDLKRWVNSKKWLLPPRETESRNLIEQWAISQKVTLKESMELESFDLMNQFVSLGMGVAFVPRRSLSSMVRKYQIQRVPIPKKLSRTLIVVSPKHGSVPEHVRDFVEGILFS